MKVPFGILLFLCTTCAYTQQVVRPLVEVTPEVTVDNLVGKISDEQFCKQAEPLWKRAEKEAKTQEPWMRPFIGVKKLKCDGAHRLTT